MENERKEKERCRHPQPVSWVINTPRMRSRPSSGLKRILGVFGAQETCLVAANAVLFLLIEI